MNTKTAILCALIQERGQNPSRYRSTDKLVKEAEKAAEKLDPGLKIVDTTDLAVRILDRLVENGLVEDCTDTDDETEFNFQDSINDVLDEHDRNTLIDKGL